FLTRVAGFVGCAAGGDEANAEPPGVGFSQLGDVGGEAAFRYFGISPVDLLKVIEYGRRERGGGFRIHLSKHLPRHVGQRTQSPAWLRGSAGLRLSRQSVCQFEGIWAFVPRGLISERNYHKFRFPVAVSSQIESPSKDHFFHGGRIWPLE